MAKRGRNLTAADREGHPSVRFLAPGSITAGSPMKAILDRRLVQLIAESIEPHWPAFDAAAFVKRATKGLAELELRERGEHIAHALAEQLGSEFPAAAATLVKSLGPELTQTEGNGLKVFFYYPHSHLIGLYGVEHFDAGLQACYELTKRFTAEFCIRPFVLRHEAKCLKLLKKWTRDVNPHVRRLVSEGTRSRLPWGMRLRNVQENPELTLPLLELLKDDGELYVRRSVANHLADILKDNESIAYETCERWREEVAGKNIDPATRAARCWIIRHAVRLPAKQGVARAVTIRKAAK